MMPIRSTQLAAAVAGLFDPPLTSGLGHVGVEIERFPLRVRDGAYEVVHHREVLGCSHWIRYSNRTHG